MRHIASLFFFLFFYAGLSFATVRTVSNSPGTIAQFNTIQAAIDASVSGDTVYIHGSVIGYNGFTISNKKIVIIGPGWSPDKNLPRTVVIISFIVLTGAGSAGSELQGLIIATNVNPSGVDNIRFIRNRLDGVVSIGTSSVSGYLFEGNWFNTGGIDGSGNYTYQSFIFQNNIFYDNGNRGYTVRGFDNSVNVLFDHNLWYGPASGSSNAFGNLGRFLNFTNNVFVRRNIANAVSNSVFNNNITFNTGADAPWTVNGNTDGGGNVAGQDPQMVDQASVTNGTNNPLLNFTIAAGPANNSGTDGKDMGLLFDASGSLNWTYSRGSRLPYIFSMTVTTPTVAPGGSVSVTVESRRNN